MPTSKVKNKIIILVTVITLLIFLFYIQLLQDPLEQNFVISMDSDLTKTYLKSLVFFTVFGFVFLQVLFYLFDNFISEKTILSQISFCIIIFTIYIIICFFSFNFFQP